MTDPTPLPDMTEGVYPDAGTPGDEKWLQLRWQDNRSEKWSKTKMVSLGKQGETMLIRRIVPMGHYRSRQFEFVSTDSAVVVISAVEDDNGVLA